MLIDVKETFVCCGPVSDKKSGLSVYLFVSDLRQELAVRQKERRPSSSLGKDGDRPDLSCPSFPVTPSKPLNSYATPPASAIRRGIKKTPPMSNGGTVRPIY